MRQYNNCLTKNEALQIYHLIQMKVPKVIIADRYKVSRFTITNIEYQRNSYAYLKEELNSNKMCVGKDLFSS